jgi:hypothetical protein
LLKGVQRQRREVGGKSGRKGRVWILTGCGKGGHRAKGGIREDKVMNLLRITCFIGIWGVGGKASFIPGSYWEVSVIC